MQKLRDGEIDLLTDVSYSAERAEDILYSSIPMGTETYYLFTAVDNEEITSEDISTLNGKRIGVAKGTIQEEIFKNWAKMRGLDVQLVEMTLTEDESLERMNLDFDAYVTIDVYGKPETTIPVYKIGSSDFYFAVSKERPDLLADLDVALSKIQDENKYYAQQLYDKYLSSTETRLYLSTEEKKWLDDHGTIRVGYQDNYLAFCAKDPATGRLTGALKDYLEYAETSFENAGLKFEAVAYPTVAEALQALKDGEIDCMFPANLTEYDAEEMDLLLTPALMRTEMDAVVRSSQQKEFVRKQQMTVAVNQGNTNYDLFLADHYPDWKRAYFKDTPAGLKAVSKGKADCVIISNYRYSNISKKCEKLHLTTVYTGLDIDYYFAVRKGDRQLYSILTRVTGVVPEAVIHKALTYYSTEDVKTSVMDVIRENLLGIVTGIALVLLIILILLLRGIRAEKKIKEERHLIKNLNKQVYVDALTSVRNKGAFSDSIGKIQDRLNQGEQFEFAIGIFDCNDLKKINDEFGHDKGDVYLKTACNLICKVFLHSPVFRIGGDEFAVILQNGDYDNQEELLNMFENRRMEICAATENKWEEVHIAYGIAVYDPQIDPSVNDVARRADKIMYEYKRMQKQKPSR